jgi:NhaP-type Na+/H+ or K+/H+ antiporter
VVGKVVVHLRNKHEETLGRDEFICLGLIAFSYGAALWLKTYGFLAVFAAGLALRHIELRATGGAELERVEEKKTEVSATIDDPEKTPVNMARAVLNANEQLERIVEVAMVLILGVMLSTTHLSWDALWLVLALFLVIRPAAVVLGTVGANATKVQKLLLSWFGIRGIGSLYYLMYAIQHGLPDELSAKLTGLVLTVIAASIFVHGISVTPIMSRYAARKKGRSESQSQPCEG